MINLKVVKQAQQDTWRMSAVVNLTLGGAGTGFYILSILLNTTEQYRGNQSQLVSFPLLAPAIVGFGFLAIFFEVSRPLRARQLLRNLSRSWMSIEGLAGAIFIASSLITFLFPLLIFNTVAVSAALVLMISQGFIVFRGEAVAAWNVWSIPVIFLTSGFMTGCGIVLINIRPTTEMAFKTIVVSLICILLNFIVWLLYLYCYRSPSFYEATIALRRRASQIITVGIGHILPFVLLSMVVTGSFENDSYFLSVVCAVSGLSLIVGGFSQKNGIILKAGYHRGIALKPDNKTNYDVS